MDVKTFRFNQLPRECKRQMRREAIRLFPAYDVESRLENLFNMQYNGVEIRRIYGIAPSQHYIITDLIITLSRDKYAEFCLRWM